MIEIVHSGQWQVATRVGRGGVILGWAKPGEIVGTGPLDEPGEPVHFEFGATRDEVVGKLLAEVGAAH